MSEVDAGTRKKQRGQDRHMEMHEAFLGSIQESLYDDTPRLVYADWLEDDGDPRRAEFIRVQCELEPIRDRYEVERAGELHRREEELLRLYEKEWLGPSLCDWNRWAENGASAEFRRGFVDTISMPVTTFLSQGEEARRLQPAIRRVVLFRVHGHGKQLAASPALAGLAELELAGWYSDDDASAIASSPHLGNLQVLELWLGRRGSSRDAGLCRLMGGAKAWPGLRELTLLNPNDENERGRKRLVKVADEAAGRNLAAYRRGWPESFPFAADFWYTFPGYLPNGRMAMAVEDHRAVPPTLRVITFDADGKQTAEVMDVPPPPDLLAIPVDDWFRHKERIGQHLTQSIGLRPGFTRIRDCRFSHDDADYHYNRPYWEVYSTQGEECEFGVPDRDREQVWAENPRGYAGSFAYRLRNQEYVFGWDRYADKRGRVHST